VGNALRSEQLHTYTGHRLLARLLVLLVNLIQVVLNHHCFQNSVSILMLGIEAELITQDNDSLGLLYQAPLEIIGVQGATLDVLESTDVLWLH